MNITIDCRWINSSGVGVFNRECLSIFLDSCHFFLLIGNYEKLRIKTEGRSNVEILNCSIAPFSLREIFTFPRKLLKKINKGDLYYSPFFNIPGGIKVPVYTTIHDMVFPDMPELVSSPGLAVRMFFYRRAYKKSFKIFTVSEFSKSRIEYHLGEKKPVIVTYSAVQPFLLSYRTGNQSNFKKKNTIVFVGNIKKHKGLDCLLEAFLLARAEGLSYQLVIIGSRNNFRTKDNLILRKIDSLDPDSVSFTGFVSNEELTKCLSTALLLVQPSLYEGFGLPPLEAMVLGTSALISDIPVLKEIYDGFPVTFFKAGNIEDLKEKMLFLLSEQKTYSISLPKHLIEKYTFQKTASVIMSNFVKND
jgi:glycosyltransferase involved in cell wall biosynthesis